MTPLDIHIQKVTVFHNHDISAVGVTPSGDKVEMIQTHTHFQAVVTHAVDNSTKSYLLQLQLGTRIEESFRFFTLDPITKVRKYYSKLYEAKDALGAMILSIATVGWRPTFSGTGGIIGANNTGLCVFEVITNKISITPLVKVGKLPDIILNINSDLVVENLVFQYKDKILTSIYEVSKEIPF